MKWRDSLNKNHLNPIEIPKKNIYSKIWETSNSGKNQAPHQKNFLRRITIRISKNKVNYDIYTKQK